MSTTLQDRRMMVYFAVNAYTDHPHKYGIAAYRKLSAVAAQRLIGKEHDETRPNCGIKLALARGGIAAEFKPRLEFSPLGWSFRVIAMSLKARQGFTLKVYLHPDGTMKPSSWSLTAGERLMQIAGTLLEMLAQDAAYLLAAADADHCAICGRALTDPDSRDVGIGPECIKGLFTAHDLSEAPDRPSVNIAERIREIRRQMSAAHPDKGGSGDGALFARLTAELDALRSLEVAQ